MLRSLRCSLSRRDPCFPCSYKMIYIQTQEQKVLRMFQVVELLLCSHAENISQAPLPAWEKPTCKHSVKTASTATWRCCSIYFYFFLQQFLTGLLWATIWKKFSINDWNSKCHEKCGSIAFPPMEITPKAPNPAENSNFFSQAFFSQWSKQKKS